MAITQVANIVRVTFKFTEAIGATVVDYAECGVTYRAGAVPTDAAVMNAVLQDMANAAYASVQANVTPTHWGPHLGLASTRVAVEDTNGHTLYEKFCSFNDTYHWNGTSASRVLPWDNAVALSLYAYEPGTFDPQGKSKRGRMYLPGTTADTLLGDNSGLIDPTVLTDISDDWGQVLQELQEHDYSGFPTFSPVLGVNSRRHVAFFPVTWLRIDNKMDTQRRRFNKQNAAVAKAAFPHA